MFTFGYRLAGASDYRGEQSLSMVAHSALSGIDHKGRVFLALVIYYRHTGPGFSNPSDLPARLIDMLDKEDLQRARLIAAAIRTAHMLSIGRPGTIDEIPITYEDGLLVLHLPPTHAPLDGERLRNRAAALARQLGLDADVRLG